MMMVRDLRRAHRRLVADQPLAVFAEQAVHVDVAGADAFDPLDERVEDQRMVAEVAGLQEQDLGVAGRDRLGLLVDPPHQHAGEQEIREHHDLPEAEPARALEQGIDPRGGDAAVADLGPAEAHALPEHARDLGDVAVGVRVGGAAADHREQGLLGRDRCGRGRERVGDPVAGGAQELGIEPEVAAEVDPDAVLGGVGVEHRGHVVLDVAGGEQHARDRQHVVDAARPQTVEAVAQDRPGELEKAALDRVVRQARAQAGDQAAELRDRAAIARAVATDHDADRTHGRSSPLLAPWIPLRLARNKRCLVIAPCAPPDAAR